MPAAEWLKVIMDEEAFMDDLFMELLPDPDTLVLDVDVDLNELAHVVLSQVCGRPWYMGLRLALLVRDNWNVVGADMLRRGVDAEHLSLSGWLDVALLTVLHHTNREDHAMLMSQLEMPPVEEREQVMEELEMSHDAFLSLMR